MTISVDYFTSLRFLNEFSSPLYFALYYIAFFYFGGFYVATCTILISLVLTVVINRFVINPIQPVPSNAALFITGCSTGIGFESALSLASQGFHVYATVRKESDKEKLLTAAKSKGLKLVVVMCDVTQEDSIAHAYEEVKADITSKKLALLSVINNAGYSEVGPLETIPINSVKKEFDTNVFGVMQVTNAFLPLLRDSREAIAVSSNNKLRPSVVHVSSVVGTLCIGGVGVYCSSKFAVEAIADAYRMELQMFGINSITVQPGSIATNFMDTCLDTAKNNDLNEEMKQNPVFVMYKKAIDTQMLDSAKNVAVMAQPAHMVTDVFSEAILTPQPLPKYRAGRDAQFMRLVNSSFLPYQLIDITIGKYFR